ncbi:hypothetical protein ACL02S_11925 [Nocardia sp. 004]|uniref:hypothetical protein n=1 Tax=Nocardia sp. 004 TaxID=3385978 RepID=UPI0039A3BB06
MLRAPTGTPPPWRRRPRGRRRKQMWRRGPESGAAQQARTPEEQSLRPGLEEWQHWLEPTPSDEQSAQQAADRQLSIPIEPEPATTPTITAHRAQAPMIVNRSGPHQGTPVRRPRRPTQQSNSKRVLTVLIVLGIVVVTGSIVLTIIYGSDTRTRTTAAPSATDTVPITSTPPAVATAPAAIATPGCVQQQTVEAVSGTDPGGTGSGPEAILAFEYAYYAERSGYRARTVVAPDAAVPPADQIQRGIDRVPIGTRYCVLITPAGDTPDGQARWKVRLTQQLPGVEPNVFAQVITTRTGTDRTLITGIAAG